MPKYTGALEDYGLHQFIYIPLSADPSLDYITELRTCTGVIICGGATVLYRNYIVETAIGSQIKELYRNGIPIAGFSAGALIAPEHCVIPPVDNEEQKHLFLEGLGLIKDIVVSVHYSKWNEESNLKYAIEKKWVSVGYGIDDHAGLYFQDEVLHEAEGNYHAFEIGGVK